ncbi:MBL fold metallo-hydrolase [Lipingzhangella sp. LS1_29]|uniref:MBL fold metallo-hydrolase n=1 Tax=Lipingzhangella rawalii TaxID=2055835 RepID=A0ABU2H3X7_9ACTN|nr:MBL fold metallo-hydrolase [Lipingzhangella rawalii]MDS1270008.1 MBL fold metallo-hydrolase [Lipingzhangella rawalii]
MTTVIDGSGTLRAHCLLCPNPGPMTLSGTNTWVLREPGADRVVVVDPGPQDERHLERVARSVQEQGARVVLTLLTHGHPDHSEGARYFSELTGAPVHAVDPRLGIAGEGQDATLTDGQEFEVDGLHLRILETPGHTPDSVCVQVGADDVLLTGDTVLGQGTTVITEDGLGAYLDSLRRLRDLVAASGIRALLPGHGPICPDPAQRLTEYLTHREQRLEQVSAAVAAGAQELRGVVARVYGDLDPALVPAAESSVRAQLRYLAARGEVPAELARS